jgi:hypothetical protein
MSWKRLLLFTTALGFLVSAVSPSRGQPMDSAFNFQGELRSGSQPSQGRHDFQVLLYAQAVGGHAIDGLEFFDVEVRDGLFSLALDFTSAPFEAGLRYWIEISVRESGDPGPHTLLKYLGRWRGALSCRQAGRRRGREFGLPAGAGRAELSRRDFSNLRLVRDRLQAEQRQLRHHPRDHDGVRDLRLAAALAGNVRLTYGARVSPAGSVRAKCLRPAGPPEWRAGAGPCR